MGKMGLCTNSLRQAGCCRELIRPTNFVADNCRWRRRRAGLEEKRHLIVEAGTGTGKTLAYLVPVIRSGKTGNHLYRNEEPARTALLQRHSIPGASSVRRGVFGLEAFRLLHEGPQQLPLPEEALRLTDQPVLSGLEEIEQYRAIAAWEKNTATGDRAELAELPEASLLWHKLDARSDTCTGQKCSE